MKKLTFLLVILTIISCGKKEADLTVQKVQIKDNTTQIITSYKELQKISLSHLLIKLLLKMQFMRFFY